MSNRRRKMREGVSAIALIVAVSLIAGCAGRIKAPSMRVKSLGVKSLQITGVGLNIGFMLRNQEPHDLVIERFEYELKLNGKKLGKGYHADEIKLRGFGEAEVKSTFDINFLRLPAGVKAIFDRDAVEAEAYGTFYIRHGGALEKVRFRSKERVSFD